MNWLISVGSIGNKRVNDVERATNAAVTPLPTCRVTATTGRIVAQLSWPPDAGKTRSETWRAQQAWKDVLSTLAGMD